MCRHVPSALLAALVLVEAAPASAQAPTVMLALGGDLQTPVTSPAIDRYDPGGALSIAALFEAYPFLLPSFRVRTGLFGDGPAPHDETLADPGVGSLTTLSAGARLRPEGFGQPTERPRATGFFLEIDAGVGLTGSNLRPAFDVGIGWQFVAGSFGEAGQVDLGPVVRFTHVVQTEQTGLDGSSAYVLSLGIEAVLFDAPVEPEEVMGAREEARDPEARDQTDRDDDGDGISDTSDACPRDPEDADGFEDGDGCPEPDDDRDGILDGSDACPNDAETVNGNEDTDGCPDEGLIELVDDRIVLEEHVLFDLNRARMRHAAHPILRAVARLLQQHPEWLRVRIEGHADARGEESWNVELSQRRAAQVRHYLESLGIAAERLSSEGYGSSRPRMEGDGEEAYRANRRVEVIVVAREGDAP